MPALRSGTMPPRSARRCGPCVAPRTADRAHLAGAAAEEALAAVRLETGDVDSGRHLEALEDVAALRVDPAQVARIALPGRVPELAVHPGDAGDEAVGLEGAQDGAGLGVDLVDLSP